MIAKKHNKHTHLKKSKHSKGLGILISIALILSLAVSGTFAYIIATTKNVENQFAPASVTCHVNSVGNNFTVTNTGNIDAYIRAAIVVNWMDKDGNVRGIAPSTSDYTLSVNTTDWRQDNTGYYYYKYSVSPNTSTNYLIPPNGITVNVTAPAGYEFSVEVVAEAIQAQGTTDTGNIPAYQNAWSIGSISN